MKLDFSTLAGTDPADRPSDRYAELIARAVNGVSIPANLPAYHNTGSKMPKRLGGLDARIAFFGSARQICNEQIFGAFLPESENIRLVSPNSKNDVNLSSSMNGKPSFLGSRYPGSPGTLRGMEN